MQAECDRLEKLGVEFKKRPQDGKMKHIAFIYDPDRYWCVNHLLGQLRCRRF